MEYRVGGKGRLLFLISFLFVVTDKQITENLQVNNSLLNIEFIAIC